MIKLTFDTFITLVVVRCAVVKTSVQVFLFDLKLLLCASETECFCFINASSD